MTAELGKQDAAYSVLSSVLELAEQMVSLLSVPANNLDNGSVFRSALRLRDDLRSDDEIERIRRALPENTWDVCVWKKTSQDYVFGVVDGADRTRLIREVLQKSREL